MKNHVCGLIAIVLALFASSCDNSRSAAVDIFTLEGEVLDATEGEMIRLSYPIKRGDAWYEHVDTTYIKDGKFQFSGKTRDVVPALLLLENMDDVRIYIEPSPIKFSTNRNRLYDYSLSGLSIDDELARYKEYFAEYDKMTNEYRSRVQHKNEKWLEAYNAGLESANTLMTEFYALVAEYKTLTAIWPNMAIKFIEEHPNYKIVPHLIDGLISYEDEIENFQKYWDKLSKNQRDSAVGELLSLRYKFTTACGGEVGCKAFDFCLEEFNGGSIQLSDLYSTGYVLLDFWASWCRPCIGEIPALRAFYDAYGDKVHVVSLSTDEDKEQWREAVPQHNLNQWPQLYAGTPKDSDSYYFREQADLSKIYGIEFIPCFILIDKQGVIVGRWSHLTANAIEDIKQIIGQESK